MRQVFAAEGFNSATDIDYSEINYQVEGICVCGKKVGMLYSYWEPFLAIDTSATANYSAFLGSGGSDPLTLPGKNKSQDTVDLGESTFAQAHGWLMPLFVPLCSRNDYGVWYSEWDSMWQDDLAAAFLEPEATLFANKGSQMACIADAVAVNVGFPLDLLFWCVGSGGSAYPLTGRVADDNLVQANSTIAARMIYKLNRIGMICDPALGGGCGCTNTPVWIKSDYKMRVIRPGRAGTYPLGKSATIYGAGVNPPYHGALGPEDEFLWLVYRFKLCCTCCN